MNHDEQKVIEEMLELREKGWSYRRIATALNERSVDAKNGGQWFPSTVRSVLKTSSIPE
jgi:hypothetical protein